MGSVYFIRSGDTNIYKIGHTQNTASDRLRGLQTGNPYPLTVAIEVFAPNSLHLERDLHKRFASRKYRSGSEWYTFSETEISAFSNSFKRKAEKEKSRLEQAAKARAEVEAEQMKQRYYQHAVQEVSQSQQERLSTIDIRERELAIREQVLSERDRIHANKKSNSDKITGCLVTSIIVVMSIIGIISIAMAYLTWY